MCTKNAANRKFIRQFHVGSWEPRNDRVNYGSRWAGRNESDSRAGTAVTMLGNKVVLHCHLALLRWPQPGQSQPSSSGALGAASQASALPGLQRWVGEGGRVEDLALARLSIPVPVCQPELKATSPMN